LPIIYYGDEIGMGDNIWLPDRHGCRTPMQWDADKNGGFSAADETYLPVNGDYARLNVAAQEDDPVSFLNLTRFLIQTRQGQPALKMGQMEWVETEFKGVLAFRRYLDEDEGVLCVFNLTNQPQTFTLKRERLNLLATSDPHEKGTFTLAAYAVYWFQY